MVQEFEKVIKRRRLHKHHTASRRGYCATCEVGKIEQYEGRFGKGIIVIEGRYRGSNNYTQITYYVK